MQLLIQIGQKWTDDIKKDVKFVGVGSVNNQTHLANGAKMEKPSDDRSFSYEFKENQIYAFGLLGKQFLYFFNKIIINIKFFYFRWL